MWYSAVGCIVPLLLSLLVAPLAVQAQQTGKLYRIGFLGNSTAALEANLVGPFREGLRELGYVEGHNLVIEYRWAEGTYERFPALIAELLASKVEVIVTAGTPASLAVKKATTSVPLVMVAVGDPVATGLVASLARPGGNITGLTSIGEELDGKRLELLREVVPNLSHVAGFGNSGNASHRRRRADAGRRRGAADKSAVAGRACRGSNSRTHSPPSPGSGRGLSWCWGIGCSCTTGCGSWTSRPSTACPGCMRTGNWSRRAGSCPLGPSYAGCTGAPPTMSTGSSRVRSPATCPWSDQRRSSWSST